MKLITGYQSENHITALQDACWHRGIWGTDCILQFGNNLSPTIISNNEIQVQSGVASVQGRFFIVEPNTYDSITINNGTVGENRIDLIVAQYSKNTETQVETMTWEVIQGTPSTGTPSTPSYTQGNIDNGDTLVQFPFLKVSIEGITVTSVNTLMSVVNPIDSENPVKLFEGGTSEGTLTLTDSIYNYRFLVFAISATYNETNSYGYGVLPVIKARQDGYQVVESAGSLGADPNKYASYTGGVLPISDTQIKIVRSFVNVIHTSGSNHGGGTVYYVREIWGIR